ncbi:MAG: hypothetical protein KKI02_02100, partial [Planctomycetes bacterium]|nr:hypothetical protein [Planctomycetota bacterium]
LRLAAALAIPLILSSLGCGPREPPFEPKPASTLAVKHCFDTIGHIPGSEPWILGGTCCCTPTQKLLDQYQADGFCRGMTLSELLARYDGRSIMTALHHKGCNNACEWGPHVVAGGKCMAPPIPGTRNYEAVATGITYVWQPPQGERSR